MLELTSSYRVHPTDYIHFESARALLRYKFASGRSWLGGSPYSCPRPVQIVVQLLHCVSRQVSGRLGNTYAGENRGDTVSTSSLWRRPQMFNTELLPAWATYDIH
jgi:hypothetical protein